MKPFQCVEMKTVRKRANVARLAVVAAFLLFLTVATLQCFEVAFAETPSLNSLPTTPSSPNERTTFWLLDERGTWRVPLPNWTLEEIMRAVDARREEASTVPYSIQSIDARGVVADGVARLTIQYSINTIDGDARVPLGLREGVYIPDRAQGENSNGTGGFSYEGPGLCALDVDPETGEYVAQFRSTPELKFDSVLTNEEKKDSTASLEESSNSNASSSASVETTESATSTDVNFSAASSEEEITPVSETSVSPALSPESNAPTESSEQGNVPVSETSDSPAPSSESNVPTESSEQGNVPVSETSDSPAPSPESNVPTESSDQGNVPVSETLDSPAPSPEANASTKSSEQGNVPVSETSDSPAPSPESNAPTESSDQGTVSTPENNAPAASEAPTESSVSSVSAVLFDRYADEADSTESRSKDDRSASRLYPIQYVVTLELCFAVDTIGRDEYSFSASFPASVHSQLTLEVPISDVELGAVRGAVASPPTVLSETSSELTFRGLGRGGERVEFLWRKSSVAVVDNLAVYQVEDASIEAMLDSRETSYDVSLPIRVFGGETDVFVVRLPDGASLLADSASAVGSNGTAYEIRGVRELTTSEELRDAGVSLDEESFQSGAVYAEIRLAQKTSATTLNLKARVPVSDAEVGNPNVERPQRAIAGFDVMNARKQYGQVKLNKTREFDFSIVPIYGVASTYDSVQNDGSDVYSYYSQPFLITAQGYQRQGVVNVKPEYQIAISEDSLQLRAYFHFSVFGAKTTEFKIKLYDWNFASVKSDDVVDPNAVYLNETTGETVFSLRTAVDGEASFELTATRALNPSEANEVSWTIPLPSADWVEPAPVVVAPDDNMEVVPDVQRCLGLKTKSARAFSLNLETQKSFQTPLYFQARQAYSKAPEEDSISRFVATTRKLQQEVEVDAKSEFTIDEKGAVRARQTFEYEIRREPLDAFLIQVPAKLLEQSGADRANNVKFFIDGKLAPAQNVMLESNDDQTFRQRILLGDSAKLGSCVVTVQYDCKSIDFLPNSTNYVDLFLMQPEDGTLTSNELTVTVPMGVVLDYENNNERFWILDESGRSDDGTTSFARYSSVAREFSARFAGEMNISDALGSVVVERAWVQSWLAKDSRFDRVAYKMTCDRDFIELRLPKGVAQDRVSVALDNTVLRDVADPQNGLFVDESALRIPISSERREREFLLEISYASSVPLNTNGFDFIDFPHFIDDSVWIRRVYWQAILPFDRHIISDPTDWTSEFKMSRKGGWGFYRREASMDQDSLCDWIGCTKRPPLPEEVNSYLFSRFDAPETSKFYVANRALLLFAGSGIVLLFGLGLIYFPIVRRREPLFAIVLGALVLAAFRPALALLFLQTTTLGIVLALLTAVLSNVMGRRGANQNKVSMPTIVSAAREEDKKRATEREVNED